MPSLLELALLGTADAPPETPIVTGTGVDALLDQRDDPIERRLLIAAGAQAILHRAAGLPRSAPEGPVVSAAEVRPILPDAISRVIVGLMRGEQRDLLPAALSRLGGLGYVLSPAASAAFLGRVQPSNQDAIRPLLGARARWLAGLNPMWSWVLDAPGVEASGAPDLAAARTQWDDGTASARRGALRVLRAAAPDEANALLFAGWTGEPVKGRLWLLEVVGEGLRAEDGPFLEHLVASDRSQRVKDAARRLLVRAGGTALAERLLVRAAGCLSLHRPEPAKGGFVARVFGRGGASVLPPTLEITPPTVLDPSWEADGIADVEPPGAAWGRRTHWLVQVLSLVDPEALADRLGVPVGDLVLAVTDDDRAILLGLCEGALLHRKTALCARLWDRWQRAPEAERRKDTRGPDVQGRLLGAMGDDDRCERIAQLLDGPDATLWWPPLAVVEGIWPDAVGTRWVRLLELHLRGVQAGDGEGTSSALTWRSSLTTAAARLPAGCLVAAERLYEPPFEQSPRWSRALPEFKSRISTRLHLERALAALPPAGVGASP